MSNDLGLLAEKCIEISDELADYNGFVAARNLVSRFDARIVLRPLLVEAMLASVESDVSKSATGIAEHKWAIFLDNETYSDVTEHHIAEEGSANPLPSRLRNTIAHELVHSLAFQAKEFGLTLTGRDRTKENWEDFVRWIEAEAEKLSPFLLISDKFLDNHFSRNCARGPLELFQEAMWQMGVSRYVLVNRLALLRLKDKKDILGRPCLGNIAVGIGEWLSADEARLKDWPLFVNFERNIVPEFLIKLRQRKQFSLETVFEDSSFFLRGGEQFTCETSIRAGTLSAPDSVPMRILCSVEDCVRRKGAEFLFVVSSVTP